jgi:putative component of membrane protein insertase Oxa1/YidC/SpoIIIJ protein YidD
MNQSLLVLLMILSYSICRGQKSNIQENQKPEAAQQTYTVDSNKKKESAVNDYIGFYQKYISNLRGHACPMYPSCSNYGLKTFSETNFVNAFIMTSDRLLRCGHDHRNYSLTLGNDGFKFVDYPAYDKPPAELYYARNSYYFAFSDFSRDDSTYTFIKKLINNQYYQEALLEIMRIEFQNTTFDIEIFINKIICLKALGAYEKALFAYENKCPQEYKSNTELAFQISLIHYKLQNYNQAFEVNSFASAACSDTFCKPKIILLNGLLYANKNDWQNAVEAYQSLTKIESHKQVAAINFQLATKGKQLKNKSSSR